MPEKLNITPESQLASGIAELLQKLPYGITVNINTEKGKQFLSSVAQNLGPGDLSFLRKLVESAPSHLS